MTALFMVKIRNLCLSLVRWSVGLALAGLSISGPAVAAEEGVSNFFTAPEFVTPVGMQMEHFHNMLIVITTAIVLFVLILLVYVVVKFNAKANPVPSKTTHNTFLEVVWTLVPVLILLVIAVPSFRLIYEQEKYSDAEVTIKMTGHQWYWNVEYSDHKDVSFDMVMVPENELQSGQLRLLTVDNVAYIPSGTKIRFQTTGADVLHAFSMPNFGIKMDAIPGKLNETWALVDAQYEGRTFYGQCAEICGTNHAYMPVAFKVVSPGEYKNWIKSASARLRQGRSPGAPAIELAAAE